MPEVLGDPVLWVTLLDLVDLQGDGEVSSRLEVPSEVQGGGANTGVGGGDGEQLDGLEAVGDVAVK